MPEFKRFNPVLPVMLLAGAAAFAAASAQEGRTPPPAPHGGECVTCHVSPEPDPDNAALHDCQRPGPVGGQRPKVQDAPDFFILDELSEIYVPVVFPHRLHAGMTEMGLGCVTCHHHYDNEDHIVRCSHCHSMDAAEANLAKPSLKGAYHRQCMGCHREWSHETQCVNCHAKRVPGQPIALPEDRTDFIGASHANVKAPDVHVYEVEDFGIIGFRHRDHVERFGIGCAECHRQWDCTQCHEAPERRVAAQTVMDREPHGMCNVCHQREVEERCDYCHSDQMLPPFDHGKHAGFSLRAFHASVACQGCHGEQTRFTSVEQACAACHSKDWMPEHFDHTIIGVHLDEGHSSMDCAACHPEGLGTLPNCALCHDDGRTKFPAHGDAAPGDADRQARADEEGPAPAVQDQQ
jgi:hypothetical protein